MANKRSLIPKEVAAKVLFDSDRTCCVCRKEKQRIQIHHIDENTANYTHKNLAVLCFDCHWETQIRGGFDRKLDADQIRLYKENWLKLVKSKILKDRPEDSPVPEPAQVEKDYIEYEVVQDSIIFYSHTEVLKSSVYFAVAAIASILSIVVIGFMGLHFREPLFMWFVVPILMLGGYYLNKHRIFVKFLFLPQNEEIDKCVEGVYVHKGNDGNYTVYEKVAKCIYPQCDGVVKMFKAPPRERHKYGVIGRCGLDPNLHTYTVDFNGIGYPKKMDFRPLPQQAK